MRLHFQGGRRMMFGCGLNCENRSSNRLAEVTVYPSSGAEIFMKLHLSKIAWACGLSATLVGYLMVQPASGADDEQSTKKSVPAGVVAAGEKTSPDAANEPPDQWIQRIFKKYSRPTVGSEKDYEAEKSAFLEKNSDSPLRWRLKLLDAQRALLNATLRADGTKQAIAILSEVLAAKDAPEELREQASVMQLQLSLQGNLSREELIKLATNHITNFPKSTVNDAVGRVVITKLTEGKDEEQSIALLQELKSNPVAPLAAAAAKRIEQLENLINITKKKLPLDLKFAAVDGRNVDLEAYRGKVVLVDFWATWCGPCVAGLPEVLELYKKYHDQGLEIVGISFDQDKEALQKFVKEKDMPWPQYFDGKAWQNDFGQKYGIEAIPTMWLVDRDGKVIDLRARDGLANKIKKLLAADAGAPSTSATAAPTTETQ
jgi:thiol-disulfide isomerase/thioredoxin